MIDWKIGAFPSDLNPFEKEIPKLRLPALSGGLMPALYVWRQFLVEGEKGFPSECVHGGSEPFYPPPADGSAVKTWSAQRVDAELLTTRFGVYLNRWYFSAADQKLLGFETRLGEPNEDPVEIYFSDYRPVNGRMLPHRIQVQYENHHYGTITVTNYKLAQ